MTVEEKVKQSIRNVEDFPKKGIVFKDITPIFANPALCKEIVENMEVQLKDQSIDAIAGIESRGFFFGLALSMKMGIPFIPIRKKGKLPFHTVSHKYELEYGTAEIEMHIDAVETGNNVLIHDDLLATGGTAVAAAELITRQGGNVSGFFFFSRINISKWKKSIKFLFK